jgi:hypothetical protein
MTRVNVGIKPSELCTAHLVAEYRELPRCFALSPKPCEAPERFKLGTGHMKWCALYKASLCQRQAELYAEMLRRGYKPQYEPRQSEPGYVAWPSSEEARARPLLIARINQRLQTMKSPKWPDAKPSWSV